MKSIVLFLALATALCAQPLTVPKEAVPQLVFATNDNLFLEPTTPLNLAIRAGDSSIVINLKTGQVDLPKDMTLPDAAVAFWLRVAQAFPECRQAMLTGDPTPLATMWGDDVKDKIPTPAGAKITRVHFILFTKPDGTRLEAGLRSDGVVVWREVKP